MQTEVYKQKRLLKRSLAMLKEVQDVVEDHYRGHPALAQLISDMEASL